QSFFINRTLEIGYRTRKVNKEFKLIVVYKSNSYWWAQKLAFGFIELYNKWRILVNIFHPVFALFQILHIIFQGIHNKFVMRPRFYGSHDFSNLTGNPSPIKGNARIGGKKRILFSLNGNQ